MSNVVHVVHSTGLRELVFLHSLDGFYSTIGGGLETMVWERCFGDSGMVKYGFISGVVVFFNVKYYNQSTTV